MFTESYQKTINVHTGLSPASQARKMINMPDAIDNRDDISISCYENEIPVFVESDLVRLYNNFFSSLPHMARHKKFKNSSTYVERMEDRVTTLFIFQLENNVVTVLNEVIAISDPEIDRFSHYIFHRFGQVTVINFGAVQATVNKLSLPFRQFNCLEDIVVDLPDTSEKYLASLGKNLRRNLRRFYRKIEQDHPSFSFQMFSDDDVTEHEIRNVVALNRARMINKNKSPSIDDEGIAIMTEHTKRSGLVCVVTIDNKICAGAITFRTGTNFFLTVIAHDPQFDAYGLGTICCSHMISECIKRGGKEFHFLWGRYDYKIALNGVQRDLNQIVIFRSNFQSLVHIGLVLSMWWREKRRLSVLYLQRVMKTDTVKAQFLTRLMRLIRRR
jgi:hypothetical protein